MLTSHQLAKILLAGEDLPVVLNNGGLPYGDLTSTHARGPVRAALFRPDHDRNWSDMRPVIAIVAEANTTGQGALQYA